MKLHHWILGMALLCTGIFSCKKDSNNGRRQTGEGVRLKHLTNAAQVNAALSGSMTEYKPAGEGSFTNRGNYPALPHIYYYTTSYEYQVTDIVEAYYNIHSQAGGGDETKEEVLEYSPEFMEVNDGRLGKPPYSNVFAIAYRNNVKDDWRYELYLQLEHINQDNQIITMQGSYSPTNLPQYEAVAPAPPSVSVAISTMLKLVEPIE